MNRTSPKYKGVWQTCTDKCPADRCREHRWTYLVELPAGPDGKRRQVKKGGYASAKEAADARAALVASHRAGTLPADRAKTFGEWLDEWIDDKVRRGEIRDTTERGYRDAIRKHLAPSVGHIKLAELRGIDLTRAYERIQADRQAARDTATARNVELAEQAAAADASGSRQGAQAAGPVQRVPVPRPVSAASIARVHAVVSGALGDAVPDLIPRSVALDAKLPKARRRKVRPPTPEQYGALLDAIDGDRCWYPLILLAGHSGLRRGELCGLRWADIDLTTGRVILGPQRTAVGYRVVEREAKTEAGDERHLWLDAGTLAELRSWHARQAAERLAWGAAYHDGGYVFTHEDGAPLHPDYVTKVVKRLMVRHGLPATAHLHELRHFRASALISAGADIAQVSKAIGHKNIAVTADLYGNLFDAAQRKLAEQAADVVPRQRPRRTA